MQLFVYNLQILSSVLLAVVVFKYFKELYFRLLCLDNLICILYTNIYLYEKIKDVLFRDNMAMICTRIQNDCIMYFFLNIHKSSVDPLSSCLETWQSILNKKKKGQCPLLYLGLIVWHMLLLKCVTAWSLSDPSLLCASKWG